jgi:hypothetical protein
MTTHLHTDDNRDSEKPCADGHHRFNLSGRQPVRPQPGPTNDRALMGGVSLQTGWLPWTVLALGVAGGIYHVGRRT